MHTSYDVVVMGGGVTGVVAAVQAARAGVRTLLVEKSSRLGGTATNGGVDAPGLFHAWGKQVIAGIGWELVERAVRESGDTLPDFSDSSIPVWMHQPKINVAGFSAVCDAMVLESGADLLLHTMLADVKSEGAGWRVSLCGLEGLHAVEAKTLIDCTGDAALVRMAGFPLLAPDECQPATLCCQISGYDTSTLDKAKLNSAFAEAVARGELKAEDACWRIDTPTVHEWLDRKGNNANHIRATLEVCTSKGRTALEVEGRRAIHRLTCWLRRQPGLEHIRVDSVSPEVGIRETVRIEGETIITLKDYDTDRTCWPDSLCYAYYPIDQHGLASGDWKVWHLKQGNVPTVPRGALIPRGSKNLLAAGRIVSSERLAFSALRVQATCMATGQVAGALAALAAQAGVTPGALDVGQVRDLLHRHKAIVPG